MGPKDETCVEDVNLIVTTQHGQVEDATLIRDNPEDYTVEPAIDLPIEGIDETAQELSDMSIYAGVEELPIVGGSVYIAVKKGYELVISNSVIDEVPHIKIYVNKDGVHYGVHEFLPMYPSALEYWNNTTSEFIDVEVEQFESGIPGAGTTGPSKVNGRPVPGFRRARNVKDLREVNLAMRTLENKKQANRKKNKMAKKSKAKNR
jgi:hypothetical protein